MPGVLLAIVTVVLLLGAIFYFVPRAPKSTTANAPAAAATPDQPVAGQLQISNVKMGIAPVGGAVNIDAQLTNTGTSEVSGVMADVNFPLTDGHVGEVEAPVQGIAVGRLANEGKQTDTGKVTGDTEELTKTPIKPGETRPIRITVNRVPATWNHQLPQIQVLQTTGE
jgi:hypothetical protein